MKRAQGFRKCLSQEKNDGSEWKGDDSELLYGSKSGGDDDQKIRDQHHERHGVKKAEIEVRTKITGFEPPKTVKACSEECQRKAGPAGKSLNSVVEIGSKRYEPHGKRQKICADDVICKRNRIH